MTEPPIDFSPLEPPNGEDYWRRLAWRIQAAAEGELARRAGARSPAGLLLRRWRPILALAASIALAAAAAIYRFPRSGSDPATLTLATLAGVSYQSAEAMVRDQPPSVGQLMLRSEWRQ